MSHHPYTIAQRNVEVLDSDSEGIDLSAVIWRVLGFISEVGICFTLRRLNWVRIVWVVALLLTCEANHVEIWTFPLPRHHTSGFLLTRTSAPSGRRREWSGIASSFGGICVSPWSAVSYRADPDAISPLSGHSTQDLAIHLIGERISLP